MDTEVSKPVRAARHTVRNHVYAVLGKLEGREGLTVEEQLTRVQESKRALVAATAETDELIEFLQARAAKEAERAAVKEEFGTLTQDLTLVEPNE